MNFNNIPNMESLAKRMTESVMEQHEQLQASFAALEDVRMAEYQRKEEARQATIETAENTSEIKDDSNLSGGIPWEVFLCIFKSEYDKITVLQNIGG